MADFKAFLFKANIFALAIAVVAGFAVNDLVKAFTNDFINPLLAKLLPGDMGWELWVFQVGHFIGAVIQFIIAMWVLFLLSKVFVKEEKKA
jgi:large conductance mechanosensitive channel